MRPPRCGGELEAQAEGVVVGALHGHHGGARQDHLDQLALGRLLGHEDQGLEAGGGADRGQGRGRVARGGGHDPLLAQAAGFGGHQEGGAVLEAAAGVQAVVLDPEPGQAQALRPAARTLTRGVLPTAMGGWNSGSTAQKRFQSGLRRSKRSRIAVVVEDRLQHAHEGDAGAVALPASGQR